MLRCPKLFLDRIFVAGQEHGVHSQAQAVFAMAPKGTFSLERLNGLGEAACKAALKTLSDEEASILTHLSCQYPDLIYFAFVRMILLWHSLFKS